MKFSTKLLSLFGAILSLFISSYTLAIPKDKTYTGAFFQVSYPVDFSLNSKNDGREVNDEASFLSPEGSVEFFVYSPLWVGKPKDYLQLKPNEKLLAEDAKKSFHKNEYLNYVLTRWQTVKAKDSSYERSYVWKRACHEEAKSSFNDCVTTIFGIKYKNKQAYKYYRDAYLSFKASLQKFADDELLDEDRAIVFGSFSVIDYPMRNKEWQRQIRIVNRGKEIWNSENINREDSFVMILQDEYFSKKLKEAFQFVDLTGDSKKNAIVLVNSGGATGCCSKTYLLSIDDDNVAVQSVLSDTEISSIDVCKVEKTDEKTKVILSAFHPYFDKDTHEKKAYKSNYTISLDGFIQVSNKVKCQ